MSAIRPDLDWSVVQKTALRHGVLALLARRLKAAGWDGVPAPVVADLRAYRSSLAARNLLLARQLLGILETLTRSGIEALPYKGPVLAAYAYGDIGLRPFSDLDVIVAERHALDARDLLLSDGYVSLSPRSDEAERRRLPPGHALALRRRDPEVVVELHWRLTPTLPLDFDLLLAGAFPFPLLGNEVPALSPEALVTVLCVHGAKHAWERLEWISGVAHVIGGHPELDWDRLVEKAGVLGSRRSLALGLELAATLGGAPVPDDVLARMGAGRVRPLARQIRAGLVRNGPGPAHTAARYSSRLRARGVSDRLRYVLYLRHPTEKDRAFVRLPQRLSFLYSLVRPVRLAFEHLWPDWKERARARSGSRALARQLVHQQRKAEALRGREDDVEWAMAAAWRRVERRLRRAGVSLDDPLVLEVGSGAHGLVFAVAGTRAIGVDPLAHDYARLFPKWQRRLPTVAASGERLPFAGGGFDIVLCDNVVDHAPDPRAIVAELVRVLRPGGALYFSVNVHHRLWSWAGRAHQALNAAGIAVEIGPFADHTVHLTADQARRLFDGLPVEVRDEKVRRRDPCRRSPRRLERLVRRLVLRLVFKNARFELVATRD